MDVKLSLGDVTDVKRVKETRFIVFSTFGCRFNDIAAF